VSMRMRVNSPAVDRIASGRAAAVFGEVRFAGTPSLRVQQLDMADGRNPN